MGGKQMHIRERESSMEDMTAMPKSSPAVDAELVCGMRKEGAR